MQLSVKLERQVLLRVVVRRQIAFFFRTVRRNALARIVNPAHDVIEVGFFADTLEVRGKSAADLAVAFADRVTGQTAATLEKLFAVSRVALRLGGKLRIETFLPEISGDGLDLL